MTRRATPAPSSACASTTAALRGYTPITELARARSTERFGVKGLLGPYRPELDADLADAPRYIAGIRDLFQQAGLAGWQDDLALLETQLDEYRAWLRADMLPRARPDNLLPGEVYSEQLRNYGVRATPEQLIADALYSYQLIGSQMDALARTIAEQRRWDDKSLLGMIRRLRRGADTAGPGAHRIPTAPCRG
ncbi:hypothetical protein [Rhodoferax sp.]|uniref:hypothetical protein n=1 Tax=Rhodoferax sp. TaxID=50421 RepID=UPI002ACD7893|nr:hypothetical protein [Rhodoferax sp.]MDZ7921156.1 hypothetical protein [Rhodoferax sp.]